MKKPYRDSLGRFAVRPKRTRRTSYGLEEFVFYREVREAAPPPPLPVQFLRPVERERERPFRSAPREEEIPYREEKRKPPKKKPTDWEDLNDILNSYIEDMDLEEDDIGGSP